MKAVIAIDSFKGSLSTFESGEAVAEAIKSVYPDAQTVISPLADGGEGTVKAIVGAHGGRTVKIKVTGPLGESVDAEYGIIDRKATAVIEMSEAAGLTLVPNEKRNPLYTTTYGVGELILDAIDKGARKIIIGIGGSATNDGGVGMLEALGFELLDKDGVQVERGALGVGRIARICTDRANKALHECEIIVACDVNNPLCGENGASAVYGPQKGATPETVKLMDGYLASFARKTADLIGKDLSLNRGAGAAGGLGFALMAYLGASLMPGAELVITETALEDAIKDADIVITGEGRLDGQSCMGKAPVGVAKLAKKYGKTVIAFGGAVTPDAVNLHGYGIDAFFPITRAPISLTEAMDKERAYKNLYATAEEVFRLIKAFNQN